MSKVDRAETPVLVRSKISDYLPTYASFIQNLTEALPWSVRLRLKGSKTEVAYDELEREHLWSEYEVPMHFITLEFEDVEMERGFQVDMARRRLGTHTNTDKKNVSLTLSHLSLLFFSTLLAWIKYTLWHPSDTCATRLGARDISFFHALQSEPLVALMSSSFLVWTVSVFFIYYRYSVYVNNFYLIQSICSVLSLILYLLYEYLSVRFIPETDVSVTMEEGISFTIVISLISVFYSLRFVHVMYLISIGSVVTALLRPLAYDSRIFRRLGFLTNEWNEGVFVVAALCILLVVIYCYESLLRKDFIMSLSLAAESESSDKILKSVLPDHVVSKLLLAGDQSPIATIVSDGAVPVKGTVPPAGLASNTPSSSSVEPVLIPSGPGVLGALARRRSSMTRIPAGGLMAVTGINDLTYSESHESVTTLFIELCGLSTAIAQTDSKAKSVEALKLLARLFGIFDEVAEEYGIEKIKTIGDVYMAVGGLKGCLAHPVDTVKAGREMMRRALKETDLSGLPELRLRCGIHTGPVVAGVIGRRRFAYDVWGDAVVIASRMQTTAEVNSSVHVSEATAGLVLGDDELDIQCRGPQFVKGKGEMVTFKVAV